MTVWPGFSVLRTSGCAGRARGRPSNWPPVRVCGAANITNATSTQTHSVHGTEMCADYYPPSPGRAVPSLRFGSADSVLNRSSVIASMTRASALNLITPVVVCSRSEIMAAPAMRRQHSAERVRSPDALQVSVSRSDSSRRSSRSSSNRGSFYSEGSNELEQFGSRETCDEPDESDPSDVEECRDDGDETARKDYNVAECTSCKEENRAHQALSVQQARQRSYLHGSVGPFLSLLGPSELKRTLPDGQLRVFIGTWNMNGKAPPAMLEDLLLPGPLQSIPDVVAVGTQETNGDRDEWEIGLQETLGPGHVLFHSIELGTLHLAVFVRRDLIWVCSVPEADCHSTRAASAFRTKGGVAIGFSIFGTSFLFVNCHLPAHADKVLERERDLKKIFLSLDLPKELPVRKKHRDVTSNYDVVFLCGDLNFRINRTRGEVIDVVSHYWGTGSPLSQQDLSALLAYDQLKQTFQKNKLFKIFQEAPITFPPTYKYVPGTEDFDDSTKQRVPSYTDRILWKERKGDTVKCDHYDAVTELRSSDHLPVWAAFRVPIKPGRDTIPLSAGLFNRAVYLEGMKRRVQAWDPQRQWANSSNSCTLQ